MNTTTIMSGIIGLLVGAGVAVVATYYVMVQPTPSTDHASMSMNDMTSQLENLTGDEFDAAFIDMMIAHHQGAIDMSLLSATNAKHDEVKQLSLEVISAQTQEIEAMRSWQEQWGYTEPIIMDHSNH